MSKKGFSLIEIIFTVALISIIASVAMSKFDDSLNSTNLAKIKSDILKIREGINKYKNTMILKNEIESFNSLDTNDEDLFSLVLNTPITSSTNQKASSWNKISNTEYNVYINSTDFIEFQFDLENYTFNCDRTGILCKDLQI